MSDNREQIIEKAIDSIRTNIESNYDSLESLYDNNEMNIDSIEKRMGEVRRLNDAAIEEMYNDVVNSIPEKALLLKKKHNSEI